jgi:rSAM/selenodomain-associated transferase 2
VIIPALDEATTISAVLDSLAELPGFWEVIVADGGSGDGTATLATSHPLPGRVITAKRGRATQMNAGAAAASGEVLLFLHADTRLPRDAYQSIMQAIRDPRVCGGNFAIRFDGDDWFSAALAAWYALQRRLGVYYGDSAIWIRRPVFDRLHGFAPIPIMEDYDLVRRLQRSGHTRCLPGPVITSARRWKQSGLLRTIASWALIRWLYLAGVSPTRLARLYPRIR